MFFNVSNSIVLNIVIFVILYIHIVNMILLFLYYLSIFIFISPLRFHNGQTHFWSHYGSAVAICFIVLVFYIFLLLYIQSAIPYIFYITFPNLVRTRISGSPQNARVIKGSTTTIECKVTHDPSVTVQWLWSHGGSLTNDRWRIDNNGTLTITSVRNNDIGDYTCNVLSSGGNDSATATIQVIGELEMQCQHRLNFSDI